MPVSDDELDTVTLVRAQRGEAAACRALVLRYQRPVFALLGRLLGPAGRRGEVEDLAQETFLRAFGALAGFDRGGPARLSTWLLTIATRLALDELRRTRPQLFAEPPERPAPARVGDGVDRQRLAAALAELTPDQRAVFLLCAIHEVGQEEAARALGVEVGTIKSRLARARAALRVALGEP
jgi:RNA polymerase sigma-70 factor, ECF subfamily